MDYFGDTGVVALTKVVTLRHGDFEFHVTAAILTAEQDDECEAILSGGEQQKTKVVARGQQGRTADVEQVTEMTVQYKRYREAVLLRGIRDWDLTENGQKAPIDEAHVRKLADRDRNLIFIAIKELSKPLEDKQVGESDSPPTDSSRGAVGE